MWTVGDERARQSLEPINLTDEQLLSALPMLEPMKMTPTIKVQYTTVHSSEDLYAHILNGWKVVSTDTEHNKWELERETL